MFSRSLLCACAVFVLLVPFRAPAVTTADGQTPGGAFYAIAVPDAWNGALVIWNHGYDFGPVAPNPDLGPLAPLQLAEGFAVAASSYRDNQWAVFRTRKDLMELVRVFRVEFGMPSAILVTGASLGGIVTADALERARLGNVVGAYPFCGALAGSRVWDGALDFRLTYDAVCGEVAGAALPGGATGLPADPFPLTAMEVAIRANACTGILEEPELRTADQTARLDKILASSGIPENFFLTDLLFGTFGLANLTFDEDKLRGRRGVGNIGVTYDDPDIDAAIERVRAHPAGARLLARNYTPDGSVGPNMKIVSLHTDKDGLVIVENEKEYQDVVAAGKLTVAIAVEEVPTHCGFTEAEVVAGWESLRSWIAGAPQPSAADVQNLCVAVAAGGLAAGPCRIDPSFAVPDMDGRVKPRNNALPAADGG